nr:transposase [uncultured Ruegeria sp.]
MDLLTRELAHLKAAFAMTQRERPFRCDAFVVLPDHLHAVWTLLPADVDYSTRWGAIKARFTMCVNKASCRPGFSPAPVPRELPVVTSGRYAGLKPGIRADKREGAVWQRRFWEHTIRDDRDYHNHMAYCWGNPVKHGMVEHPTDWPYSSIHREIRAGRVDPEWTGGVTEGRFEEP